MIETVYHIPNAPGLAVLADLHGRPFEHIAQALRARMPELICIPGDFIFGLWPGENQSPLVTQENVLPFLRTCAGIAPSILSLGNHEQYLDSADLNLIRSTGVTVLDNSWITRDGLVIGGLSSASVTACQRFRSQTEQAASGVRYPRIEHKQPTLPDTTWLTAFSATPRPCPWRPVASLQSLQAPMDRRIRPRPGPLAPLDEGCLRGAAGGQRRPVQHRLGPTAVQPDGDRLH